MPPRLSMRNIEHLRFWILDFGWKQGNTEAHTSNQNPKTKIPNEKAGSADLNQVRCPGLADADGFLEVLDHALVQTNACGPLPQRHAVDFLLKFQ